jgi:hypothetical protein
MSIGYFYVLSSTSLVQATDVIMAKIGRGFFTKHVGLQRSSIRFWMNSKTNLNLFLEGIVMSQNSSTRQNGTKLQNWQRKY